MAPGKKKPLSFEEKRRRLLELFFETRGFFQLKELEKLGAKQKGIVLQTVKEVVDSLTADSLVSVDRVGTSNYFWSFPSTAAQTRKQVIARLEAEQAKLQQALSETEAAIAAARDGREESKAREKLLAELAKAEAGNEECVAELQQFRDCDPKILEAKKNATKIARDAANRWTDNIFSVQSYCSKQFMISPADFCTNFSVPDDFDSV